MPPRVPSIREQRPDLFAPRPTGPPEFALPRGMQYTPQEYPAQPPGWGEIEEDMKGILQQRRQFPIPMPGPGETLSPEEMERTKMIYAWQSPTALSAIQRGEETKLVREYKKQTDAESTLQRLETLMGKVAAEPGKYPHGFKVGLERRWNARVKELEDLTGKDSGYGKYTGKGKFEIEGVTEEPGWGARATEAIWDVAKHVPGFLKEELAKVPQAGRDVMMGEGPEPGPAGVMTAPAEFLEGPQVYRDLEAADSAMKQLDTKRYEEEVARIKKETVREDGSVDVPKRVQMAQEVLEKEGIKPSAVPAGYDPAEHERSRQMAGQHWRSVVKDTPLSVLRRYEANQ